MDYREEIKSLLEKYWERETTLEEESRLRKHFLQSREQSPESHYFLFLEKESNVSTSSRPSLANATSPRIFAFPKLLRYAAVVLALVAAGFILQKYVITGEQEVVAEYTLDDSFEDPEKAYAEAREAILLLAEKINATQSKAAKQVSIVEPYAKIIKD